MNLAKASGIPDGTKFSSLEDYLNQLEGKALKVTVKNENLSGKVKPTKI